jgi:hypothetical protein
MNIGILAEIHKSCNEFLARKKYPIDLIKKAIMAYIHENTYALLTRIKFKV